MISACMIVKNEEDILVETLPVIRECFEEVIIVDTGSTDATASISEKYADNVKHFKWINDFAAARNYSIEGASQDWIIWIDADEMIKKDEVDSLKSYLKSLDSGVDGVMVPLLECKRGEYKPESIYSRVKIFRNKVGLHFERAINEQVFTKQGEILDADLFEGFNIYHWGNVGISDGKFIDKRKRNIALFEAALERDPEDPVYLILIAENYFLIEEYETALNKLDVIMSKGMLNEFYFERFFKIRLELLKSLGRMDEYFGILENLALKKPDFYWAGWKYAEELIKDNEINSAAEILKGLIAQPEPKEEPGKPYDGDSYYYNPNILLGQIYKLQKKYEEALVYYKKAYDYSKSSQVEIMIKDIEALLEDS